MTGGRVRVLLLGVVAVIALSGCELRDNGDNLVNGKTLFVEQCSRCHTLARADAKGVVGPSLDEAWQQSAKDGLGRSTFKGIVYRQILQPNRFAQVDPATGNTLPLMPANLVKGEDAHAGRLGQWHTTDRVRHVGPPAPMRGRTTPRCRLSTRR